MVVHDEENGMSQPGTRGPGRKKSWKNFCQWFSGVKGPGLPRAVKKAYIHDFGEVLLHWLYI